MEKALADWLASLGPLAPCGLVLALVLQQLCPIFPSSILIGIGGALFGPWWGLFYSWVGVVASAVVCYHLGKQGGLLAERITKRESALVATIEARLKNRSGLSILFLRAVPLFPFSLVSVLSGAFRLAFGPYLVATMVGIVPGLVLFVWLGDGVASLLYAWVKTYFLRM